MLYNTVECVSKAVKISRNAIIGINYCKMKNYYLVRVVTSAVTEKNWILRTNLRRIIYCSI